MKIGNIKTIFLKEVTISLEDVVAISSRDGQDTEIETLSFCFTIGIKYKKLIDILKENKDEELVDIIY